MIDINIDELITYVKYDRETGVFTRLRFNSDLKRMSRFIGKPCGNATSNGYLEIALNNKKYPAHKLAWYIEYGYYPDFYIDHINGNKQDNRISNLRKSSPLMNMRNRCKNQNNSTGYNGVYQQGLKFRARIKIKGKLINLGTFNTAEEANQARINANEIYEFDKNHGKDR